jgi:hypothetical protein
MKLTLLLLLINTMVWGQGFFPEPTPIQAPAANPRPYYFSGPCTSQGSWTQEALNQTQRLREITTQLRDDPSCKALGASLQRSFGDVQSSFEYVDKSMGGSQIALRDMGQEIKALRESSIENPALSGIASNHILGRMFNVARIKTMSNDQNNAIPGQLTSGIQNAIMETAGDRMARVAGHGFTLFNQTIDSLPQLNECLTQKNVMGQVLASSVSMLGALVSSGQDPLGTQTALAVSKIATFMRDKSFSEIIRKLNQQEFMSSIQCIMETTSESYCAARDSRLLFKQMTAELSARRSKQEEEKRNPVPSGRTFDNPLNGFYVLTQLSPVVTDWIFRIQIGSSPKLREDGQYQMNVLNNANTFYIKMKEIESEFNQLKRNISTYKDFASKQNYAKDLVLRIGETLLKAGGPTGENFFQNAGSEFEIYFNLLGMDTPQQVKDQGNVMTPATWLNINYRQLPIFSNPDNVPNIVWKKLAVVFEAGKANMLSYYFKNFVADQIGVIDESLIGIPYNIKSALANIDNYLAGLQVKIQNKSKDHTVLGSIADTRIRIGKIFYRYNDLLNFINANKELMARQPTPDEERNFKQALLEKNVALMEEVYDKLEVMLAKSGFLANRLVTYVTYDYQMFVKDVLNERNSESDLLYKEISYASGRLVFDQLVQMAGNNPANVEADLDMATRIFKENLSAQEMLFTDSLVGILQQLKLSATRQHVDSRAISIDSIKRSYMDGWKETPNHSRNPVRRFLAGLWLSLKTITGLEEEKYPVHHLPMLGFRDNVAYSIDDENRSADRVFNRMCVQALSFNDYKSPRWRALYNLCKDTVIKSPFNVNQVASDLKINPDDYLSVSFVKKLHEDMPDYRANHSKRICAFRDYNRRNLVVYLTMNFKNTEFLNNNNSQNPYKDIIPDATIPSVDPNAVNTKDPSQQNPGDLNIPGMESTPGSEPGPQITTVRPPTSGEPSPEIPPAAQPTNPTSTNPSSAINFLKDFLE